MAMLLESAANLGLISHHTTSRSLQASRALPQSRGLRVFFCSRSAASGINPHHPALHTTSRSIICQQQQQEAASSVGVVTDKTWNKLVLDSDIPVLVDFWAPWCGPCRLIDPIVDELANVYAGKIRCFKLNTDESRNKATEYGIRSIPAVLLFKGGQKKDAIIGAVPKATLITTIDKYLDK